MVFAGPDLATRWLAGYFGTDNTGRASLAVGMKWRLSEDRIVSMTRPRKSARISQ